MVFILFLSEIARKTVSCIDKVLITFFILKGIGIMKPEIILAVDVPSAVEVTPLMNTLSSELTWFKVGLELFTAEGPAVLNLISSRQKKIFLDLKLHDIPRTVANAVTSAGKLGVNLITVHAIGGRAMLQAAAEAAAAFGPGRPRLVAVTTLTSLNQDDFMDLGIHRSVSDQALALTELALASGIDGVVTSVHEAPALRQRFGSAPILVTPGIRPSGADVGDQKRVATPTLAVNAGSTYLVVGRPIVEAADPAQAARAIQLEIDRAWQARSH
jgi:orotidine-5'-phosphate decarboxylase